MRKQAKQKRQQACEYASATEPAQEQKALEPKWVRSHLFRDLCSRVKGKQRACACTSACTYARSVRRRRPLSAALCNSCQMDDSHCFLAREHLTVLTFPLFQSARDENYHTPSCMSLRPATARAEAMVAFHSAIRRISVLQYP